VDDDGAGAGILEQVARLVLGVVPVDRGRIGAEQAGGEAGLTGQKIPLGSRIIAVCDAFDAMTSQRPYRETTSVNAALQELECHAGTQFDTAVVEAFRSLRTLHHNPDREPHVSTVNA